MNVNVASLEFCRELSGLSSWLDKEDAAYYWYRDSSETDFVLLTQDEASFYHSDEYCPAYELGYLLRKLPETIGNNYSLYLYRRQDSDYWITTYGGSKGIKGIPSCRSRKSPEDAVAKLCIELFHQGILKPQGV